MSFCILQAALILQPLVMNLLSDANRTNEVSKQPASSHPLLICGLYCRGEEYDHFGTDEATCTFLLHPRKPVWLPDFSAGAVLLCSTSIKASASMHNWAMNWQFKSCPVFYICKWTQLSRNDAVLLKRGVGVAGLVHCTQHGAVQPFTTKGQWRRNHYWSFNSS